MLKFPIIVSVALPLIAIIALVVWCVVKPTAGRVLARIFSVLALGTGAGVLVWGICTASSGDAIRSPFGSLVTTPSEAIGWGAGFLAAGITALVLSFIGGRKIRPPKV